MPALPGKEGAAERDITEVSPETGEAGKSAQGVAGEGNGAGVAEGGSEVIRDIPGSEKIQKGQGETSNIERRTPSTEVGKVREAGAGEGGLAKGTEANEANKGGAAGSGVPALPGTAVEPKKAGHGGTLDKPVTVAWTELSPEMSIEELLKCSAWGPHYLVNCYEGLAVVDSRTRRRWVVRDAPYNADQLYNVIRLIQTNQMCRLRG